jgi:hypothetical protein
VSRPWHEVIGPPAPTRTIQDWRLSPGTELEVGARTADVGQTGEESWHVLADPEGNEFCLLRRTVKPAS